MSTRSSTESRVVPGIGVTMTRSSASNAFIRLDLPTLGFPTMAALIPSRSIFPRRNDALNRTTSS